MKVVEPEASWLEKMLNIKRFVLREIEVDHS